MEEADILSDKIGIMSHGNLICCAPSLLLKNKYEHTFILNELLLDMELRHNHDEERKDPPLIIVCNDCGREFPFTLQSYQEFIQKMMEEYNKKI